MYIGAASGAVTVGLALFLVMLSQKPEPSRADQPEPEKPVAETMDTPPPSSAAAVRLPPPPTPVAAPVSTTAPPALDRPALKPRPVEMRPEIARVRPLEPRPASSPVEPDAVVEPREPAPEQSASLPPETAAKPAPDSDTTSGPATTAPVSREAAVEGRALLKMLEAGKGPVIEIAWPGKAAERSRLYSLLTACHGMQTAMLVDQSKLYSATAVSGSAWRVNRDAVSGFVRRPSGVLTDAEKSVLRRIKAHHGMHFGAPVRLFPRAVDATLLGGLGEIIGPGYLKYKTIRARYRISGNRISIVDIRADGATRRGGVVLPRSHRCN